VAVQELADLRESSDRQLLEAARSQRRALLTEDVAHFARLARELAAEGSTHFGLVFTSPKSMPRSRSTIGLYVRVLAAFLDANEGDDALVDQICWLSPE
jgi:hypothetical protein